jgi:hypothetical protein
MSSVIISGDTSGQITVSAPLVAGTNTLTLQAATATNAVNTLATAVATTSGTSIEFTALPAWVKRITMTFSGVSTNGTSNYLIQLGTGSTTYTTSGYAGSGSLVAAASVATARSTAGLFLRVNAASSITHGQAVITLLTGNTYSMTGTLGDSVNDQLYIGGSSIALAAALTAIRITTVNGTDAFDAGSVNILYEG